MKFQKKENTSVGKWLKKKEDFNDGDTAIILDGGQQIEGQYGTQNIFSIEVNGIKGIVSFNQTSINSLVEGYGEESEKWVEKQVAIHGIKQSVQGKLMTVFYFMHPNAEYDEDKETWIIK
jgi:hypothetical protein